MARVLVHGVDRPQLGALLARRGLCAVVRGPAEIALVGDPSATPPLPSVVEVGDAAAAAAMLDAGAADVVLARDPDLLVAARLAAVARGRMAAGRMAAGLTIGDLVIDPLARRASRRGVPIPLLPREFALLLLLARAGGQAVHRETLRRALAGVASAPGTNLVAVYVSRLRAKLGVGTAAVVTDRGLGYRLVAGPGVAG